MKQRLLVAAGMLVVTGAGSPVLAELRAGSFRSAALGREVAYVVDLPPSYEAAAGRRYPVVYALHGLFEGPGFWQERGLAAILRRLQTSGAVPEFLVVAVDGGNSFFVDGHEGRYREMLTKDLVAHVEATYRVIPSRSARGLLGVSMGGYAALDIAFSRPELFAAVATHSAMLLERIPSADQGAGRWQMTAFHAVFGDPIDPGLWSANDPLALARQLDAALAPALYFDCGTDDRYGLANGHRELHRILDGRRVPHTFELAPGDHGYDFVRSRIETSLGFLGRALRQKSPAPRGRPVGRVL